MSVRIGINGFGRMGRLALRAAWAWPQLEIVHINEIDGDDTWYRKMKPVDIRIKFL